VIRYLPHAEEAIAKRSLQREWVERTVADPDWTDTDPHWPDRRRAFKAIAELPGASCVWFIGLRAPILWS